MRTTHCLKHARRPVRTRILAGCAVSAALLGPSAALRAADVWWVGYGGSSWGNTIVWSNVTQTNFALLPGPADIAVFAGSGGVNFTNTLGATSYSVLGLRTDGSQGVTANMTIGSSGGALTVGSSGVTNNTSSNLTISAPLLTSSGSYNVNASLATSTVTFSGNLTAAASLTKVGPGLLNLSGNNSYGLGTSINGGTLKRASNTALPVGGGLNINTGTVDIAGFSTTVGNLTFGNGSSGAVRTLSNTGAAAATVTVNGNITYNGSSPASAPALVNARISLPAGQHTMGYNNVLSNSYYDMVLTQPVSGAGGLDKNGFAFVALTAPSTYVGDTNINAGNLFVAATSALPSGTALTVAAGANLFLYAAITENGVVAGNYNQTVGSLAGSGTILLGTATLTVGNAASTTFSGTLFAGSGTVGGLVKQGGGTLTVNPLNLGALKVNGGKLVVSDVGTGVSPLGVVSMANNGAALGSRLYNAQIDITTTDLIVRNGSLADLADMARAGQNGATLFAGNGITSSVAAADAAGQLRYAVGVVQNNIDGSTLYNTFDGVTVGLTDVLVKFTYFGDADLNGIVDDTDFFLVNNGYGNGLTGWVNGDFDYSGTVDDTDFFLINNAYGLQGVGLRAGGSVPEPTGMGVLALAGTALLGRRRR